MSTDDQAWFDEAAGPLVRPYAVTGGRTRSDNYGLELITLVVALSPAADIAALPSEYAQIVRLCRQPMSVAEIGAHVDLPLPVVKVLLSDLIDRKILIFRNASGASEAPDQRVLQAVLDGIRKL